MNVPPELPTQASPEFSQHRSVPRILIASIVLAVIGVLIIPGIYWEEHLRGWMSWRNYEREAKARGTKLEFADFLPPPVPDSENFANIPIFDAVFRASDKGEKLPNPFNLPKRDRKLPNLDDPIKQMRTDLADWAQCFVEMHFLPAVSDDAGADVLKALDHFAAPLAQIHEAARRPHCRFPVHWEKGFAVSLPQYESLQSAAKLDALRLSAHLALHDNPAALEDFRNGVKLVTATAPEPSLIAGLIRRSNGAAMINAVWGGLSAHQWVASDLAEIDTQLMAFHWLDDYAFVMGSERGSCNGMHDIVIKDPHQLDNIGGNKEAKWTVVLAFYPVGWLYQSKVRTNRYFDELSSRIDLASHRFHGERQVPSSPEKLVERTDQFRFMLFRILAPAYGEIEKRFLQMSTITDQARLACALESFHLAHGQYPEKLSELAPECIPAVPLEIVNGEPYHYRRTQGGSFVLYSVGTDLRDDGGNIDPKLSASKQHDWVWRYPEK